MYPLSYQMIRYTYTYFESVIKINKKYVYYLLSKRRKNSKFNVFLLEFTSLDVYGIRTRYPYIYTYIYICFLLPSEIDF